MGERRRSALRTGFDGSLKLEFHGSRVTSDAGLLAYRELDDALALSTMAEGSFPEWRTGRNTQHKVVGLFRQSIFSRLAAYEDTNDAERFSVDPALRHVVGGRARSRSAASTSQMGRFETSVLTGHENLSALVNMPGRWIDQVHGRRPIRRIILDVDSSVSETYGRQEGSAWNGQFRCECYHPLFCFHQFGDVERARLRPANVSSADDWRSVLDPVVALYRDLEISRYFRGDAAFARPDIYEYLESEGYLYAIRLPANEVRRRKIAPFLRRPVGRPPNGPIVWGQEFTYRAESWTRDRRVVAKIEWHRGELFPRVGFIVTSLDVSMRRVVDFYNGRGTAEQWIKEGKNAVKWTRLSCHDFVDNQVRLQLFVLAYNLGNFLRRIARLRDPPPSPDWSVG